MSSNITFTGISSGLDTATLIDNLISAERSASDTRISTATSAANAKISALGSLKSSFTTLQTSLKTLRSSDTTQARTVTVGSGAGFTATTSTGTATGSYSIQVNRLATAEKQMSVMQSADTAVGNSGTLTFSAGGTTFDVSVSDTDTLSTLATKINKASGGNGLSATVINVDGGQRLVLSAAKTGSEGSISVTSSDSPALASALGFTTTTAAVDAEVTVDGQTRTSSSNTLTDLIDGVSLTLTSVDSSAHSLSISADTSKTTDAVSAFVTAYNSVLSTMKTVTAFTPGKDGTAGTSSALTGDAMVRSLQQQLRSTLGDNVIDLKAIGITIATDGQLTSDSSKLSSALASNPDAVSSLFSASGDLGTSLDATLTSVLDSTDGLIKLRNDSLNATLKDLQDQTTQLDARMTKLRAVYTQQYSAMEGIVTQMKSISSYLTQQLKTTSSSSSSSSS